MSPEEERAQFELLISESGTSMAALSRMLRRHPGYIQQYIRRGTPKRLPDDDRGRLARFYGVDEHDLGVREPWRRRALSMQFSTRTSISRK